MKVLFVTISIVIADQITKFMIKGIDIPLVGVSLQGMPLGNSFPVIGDFLRITFIENPGMAFGIEVVDGKLFLKVKDYKISPAQVNQVLFKYFNKPDAAIDELVTMGNKRNRYRTKTKDGKDDDDKDC